MKMIFCFKALFAGDETFERDYEIPYDATLLDFHNLIGDDLGFDTTEMASFFMSDKCWVKHQEFTSIDMGMEEDNQEFEGLVPMLMEDVVLGQIIKEKHQRLIYVFDLLSNRGLYLELINTFKEKEDEEYPKVAYSVGEAPLQFDEDNVGDEVSSMFDDMSDEFDEEMYGENFEEVYSEEDRY